MDLRITPRTDFALVERPIARHDGVYWHLELELDGALALVSRPDKDVFADAGLYMLDGVYGPRYVSWDSIVTVVTPDDDIDGDLAEPVELVRFTSDPDVVRLADRFFAWVRGGGEQLVDEPPDYTGHINQPTS